jgi:hypothetical protein
LKNNINPSTLPRSIYTHDEKYIYTLSRSYLGVAVEEEEEVDMHSRAAAVEEEEADVHAR